MDALCLFGFKDNWFDIGANLNTRFVDEWIELLSYDLFFVKVYMKFYGIIDIGILS